VAPADLLASLAWAGITFLARLLAAAGVGRFSTLRESSIRALPPLALLHRWRGLVAPLVERCASNASRPRDDASAPAHLAPAATAGGGSARTSTLFDVTRNPVALADRCRVGLLAVVCAWPLHEATTTVGDIAQLNTWLATELRHRAAPDTLLSAAVGWLAAAVTAVPTAAAALVAPTVVASAPSLVAVTVEAALHLPQLLGSDRGRWTAAGVAAVLALLAPAALATADRRDTPAMHALRHRILPDLLDQLPLPAADRLVQRLVAPTKVGVAGSTLAERAEQAKEAAGPDVWAVRALVAAALPAVAAAPVAEYVALLGGARAATAAAVSETLPGAVALATLAAEHAVLLLS